MPSSNQTPTRKEDPKEDFKLKVWFMEISWGRLTILGLCALVIILIFVLLMVKL